MSDMDHSRYHYARGRPFCGAGFPYDASRHEITRHEFTRASGSGKAQRLLPRALTPALTWALTIGVCAVMFSVAAWDLQWVMHGGAHGLMSPMGGR